MRVQSIIELMSEKTLSEQKDMLLQMYAAMSPERFIEHMHHDRAMARQGGVEDERREIVYRLLASGMSATEIAAILGRRVAEIEQIEQGGTRMIPAYAKKLAARRKRQK